MCGIAGIYNYYSKKIVDRPFLKRMTDAIQHRGPDGEGSYFNDENGVGLGHRRLAIIDLESGAQPLCNEDGTIWITYNGELYNYQELRKILEKTHVFKTQSDTEVIVHAYEEWGEECLNKFNGIFAFAIWDNRLQKLLLARDAFGVKPLYYYDDGTTFIFSSEIKAILAHPSCKQQIDITAINQLFTFRMFLSPSTGIKNLYKLSPGHYLTKTGSATVQKKYWQLLPHNNIYSFDEAQHKLDELVKKAISRQLMSDVPVGIYLSGGLDSSFVALEMSKALSTVHSFTMEFAENEGMNEGKYAELIAQKINSQHHTLKIGANDFIGNFEKYVHSVEEPIANFSAISWLFLSAFVHQHNIKVVLSGQGSDEILGGYDKYIGEKYHRLFHFIASNGGRMGLKFFSEIIPQRFQSNNQFRRAVNALGITDELARFTEILTISTNAERRKIFANGHFTDDTFQGSLSTYLDNTEKMDSVNKLMLLDLQTNLPDNLLSVSDKLNMANSVEARVPFLDLDLVNFSFSIPSSYKIKLFKKKYIFKKNLETYFDKKFINRKKVGFYLPVEKYFRRQAFKDYFSDTINSQNSFTNNYLHKRHINNLLEEHFSNKKDNKFFLLQLITLEIWYKDYILSPRNS